jgi:ribosomal 50S subunit-associated protein YjgA (DUF615 family)
VKETWEKKAQELVQQIQKAIEAQNFQKALELNGDLLSIAEQTGQIDQATSSRLRMDLVTEMIKAIQHEPVREKVTLSLPQDVLKGLRIAAAETSKEMSEIVAEALRRELKKYPHASGALRKFE